MGTTALALDETGMSGDERAGAYFPRRYVTDFFRFIKEHEADIGVVTYDDLPWNDDWDFAGRYPEERKAWDTQLASGERDPNKAYVLLQYDVDSYPSRSMNLLREPTHEICPANVMIFNERINRQQLKSMGKLVYTDYELDDELLRSLSDKGFVVAYHMNAYERGLFDTDRALEIFDRDVRQLSERFPIRFFSAHGGVPGPDGRNNRDMPFHRDWQRKLRWVHNGHTLRIDGQFSDGGHNSPRLNPASRDLRDFVRKFKPGKRYRILLHPQYYSNNPLPSERYGGTPWYDELIQQGHDPSDSLWGDVKLGYAAPVPRRKFLGIRLPWLGGSSRLPRNSEKS
jgi:hypothetical protein